MQYRKQFRLNDVITFELGSRFLVLDELDNEGQSVQRLVTGPELGEDGGTNYRFNATLLVYHKLFFGRTNHHGTI